MKKATLVAVLASTTPLFGTVFTGTVTGDTYIRNDGGTGSTTTQNDDTDNEFIVGNNGAVLNSLRGLLRFDVSSIVNDVNTIGGGNFSNLVINSATIQVFERRGFARTYNLIVNRYDYAFNPATSTWVAPAAGDSTAGGTIGTALGSQSVAWDATADNQDATITLSNSGFGALVSGHIGNTIHLILTTDSTTAPNFLSFTSDRSTTTSRHAKLTVDYTVIPAGSPVMTVDPATPHPDYTFPYSPATASPLTRTVRYKHTGTSGTITVSNVSVTNTTGTAFSAGTTSPALPATLAAGETIDIPIIATSAAKGNFTGSVFIDTDVNTQDKTLPLTASFYESGQMFGANTSMATDLGSWGGGSSWVAPGMLGFASEGMARVRGKGDPIVPSTLSSLGQATSIPNNLPDWCLDFRFSPADASVYGDYTLAGPPSGDYTDRSFQLVVQSTDVVPAPGLTGTLDDSTLINIAYMPDGIAAGGTAGFYLFNQGTWELIDFNGDGSALVLSGSIDLDTDADNTNGVGNGVLDATTGDTLNVFRMTITGSNFGTPSATYSITLNGPGAGFPKTVTGLTGFQGSNITAALPAAFAFITSDASPDSNAANGLCPSFWVDEVGWSAITRPAQRAIFINAPAWVRSLDGASGSHNLTVLNDGTGTLDLNAAINGSSLVSITSPAVFPVSIASGTHQNLTLGYDPAGLSAPNTAGHGGLLTITTNDPVIPAQTYDLTATEVTSANLVANGDFQSDSTGTIFPVGWISTGTVSNNSGVAAMAAGSTLWQDFGRGPTVTTTDMINFQLDYQFAVDAFNSASSRLRLRGSNNSGTEDVLAIRFDATGFQTADSRSGSVLWQTALATTLAINTTYHVRIIGEHFDNAATRRFKMGISTDGVTYTYGDWLTGTHTYNATIVRDVETVTFEAGAGVNMLVDNVAMKVHVAETFSSWMAGYTFAPGANTTDTGDADNDGIPNLIEQILGTAPNAATTGLAQISGTPGSVVFQHPLNANLASDVTYSYQWSTDLAEWKASGASNTSGVTATITPSAPVSGVVTVTTAATSGSPAKLFTRLTATRHP